MPFNYDEYINIVSGPYLESEKKKAIKLLNELREKASKNSAEVIYKIFTADIIVEEDPSSAMFKIARENEFEMEHNSIDDLEI